MQFEDAVRKRDELEDLGVVCNIRIKSEDCKSTFLSPSLIPIELYVEHTRIPESAVIVMVQSSQLTGELHHGTWYIEDDSLRKILQVKESAILNMNTTSNDVLNMANTAATKNMHTSTSKTDSVHNDGAINSQISIENYKNNRHTITSRSPNKSMSASAVISLTLAIISLFVIPFIFAPMAIVAGVLAIFQGDKKGHIGLWIAINLLSHRIYTNGKRL